MVINETFRRVPKIYGSSRPSPDRITRRNAEARIRVPQASGREPAQAGPEMRLKEKAESSYAFRFRPRGNRNLEYSFRGFIGVDLGSIFDVLENFSLQCFPRHVRHNFRTYLSG